MITMPVKDAVLGLMLLIFYTFAIGIWAHSTPIERGARVPVDSSIEDGWAL